jgi:hypothetical protein
MPNGKQKGASFEREICKKLSLWVSNGEREDCFWRSAMSGGRATVAAKGGKRLSAQAGDITAIDPIGNALTDLFIIECKHYKSLDFPALIYNSKGVLSKFWTKLKGEAELHKKYPLMIARENGRPTIVISNPLGAYVLSNSCDNIATLGLDMIVFKFDDVLNVEFAEVTRTKVIN